MVAAWKRGSSKKSESNISEGGEIWIKCLGVHYQRAAHPLKHLERKNLLIFGTCQVWRALNWWDLRKFRVWSCKNWILLLSRFWRAIIELVVSRLEFVLDYIFNVVDTKNNTESRNEEAKLDMKVPYPNPHFRGIKKSYVRHDIQYNSNSRLFVGPLYGVTEDARWFRRYVFVSLRLQRNFHDSSSLLNYLVLFSSLSLSITGCYCICTTQKFLSKREFHVSANQFSVFTFNTMTSFITLTMPVPFTQLFVSVKNIKIKIKPFHHIPPNSPKPTNPTFPDSCVEPTKNKDLYLRIHNTYEYYRKIDNEGSKMARTFSWE